LLAAACRQAATQVAINCHEFFSTHIFFVNATLETFYTTNFSGTDLENRFRKVGIGLASRVSCKGASIWVVSSNNPITRSER
jgi:hypothetical protein